MSDATLLPVELLRRDGGTQTRVKIDGDIAGDYANAMIDGATFPPVVAFYDGTDYWLADGFHRVIAHLSLHEQGFHQFADIAAVVRSGTRRDAIIYSVGANASHGYRRSNADKRRAVMTLLNDEEWSGWSDREIARRCNVGRDLVGDIRATVTVGNDSERTYRTKHGTEATMTTSAIGRARRELPIIAGRQAERHPQIYAAGMQETVGLGGASRITGLSTRNVAALAKEGRIEGAAKEGGQWWMPTASVVALVRPDQDVAGPEAKPEPMVYDHEIGDRLLAIYDTIVGVSALPPVDQALALWADNIGAAPSIEEVALAGQWMAEFSACWPDVAAARAARIEQVLKEIDQDVA